MCDVLSLEDVFPSQSVRMKNSEFPSDAYVSWLLLNTFPSVVLLLILFVYVSSLMHRSRFLLSYTIESRPFYRPVYGVIACFLGVMLLLTVWHTFDLIESSTCHLESCSSTCSAKPLTNMLTIIVSWKPLGVAFAAIVFGCGFVQLCVSRNIALYTSILLFFIVVVFNALSVLLQTRCESIPMCGNCTSFDTGVTHLCSLPFFDLSVWVTLISILSILQVRRLNIDSQNVEASSSEDADSNMIELRSNRQFNYRNPSECVTTTKDKWIRRIQL